MAKRALEAACGSASSASSELATSPAKVPRAVAQLKEKLGATPITLMSMKEVLGKNGYNNFCNNFRNNLPAAQKEEYAQKTASQRAEWVLQWAIDPEACTIVGFNSSRAYKDDEKREEEWRDTPEVLAGPRCFNRPEHVAGLTAAKASDGRPHELKPLAGKRVL